MGNHFFQIKRVFIFDKMVTDNDVYIIYIFNNLTASGIY